LISFLDDLLFSLWDLAGFNLLEAKAGTPATIGLSSEQLEQHESDLRRYWQRVRELWPKAALWTRTTTYTGSDRGQWFTYGLKDIAPIDRTPFGDAKVFNANSALLEVAEEEAVPILRYVRLVPT